ncbi:50S ribosomal protein L10, partial [Alphaproteobacteria bacterium]|nr:50S ribosomal protein L10 [Alphaproteobacteria bacterium]
MDRSQKEKAVDDFKKIFEEAEAVIVTQYKGINAQGINDLRTQSRSSDVTFRVTQNRLIKIALEGGIYENIADLFTGPTAIAYSKDVVAAAKVTNEFAKNNEN